MSDISTTVTAASGAKALWAAVAALGVTVVGLGGALYYTQAQKSPETAAPVATLAVPAVAPPPAVPEKAAVVETRPKPAPKPLVAKPAKPAVEPAPVVVAKPVPPKPVCTDCATVAAVNRFEREGEASGTGAVAGGVLGAIIGNQVGRGQGKDVATVIGAIGGGIAGNQVEKKMKKVAVYQVELRMDDGSRRTLELSESVAVGARVRVDGNNLAPLPAGD